MKREKEEVRKENSRDFQDTACLKGTFTKRCRRTLRPLSASSSPRTADDLSSVAVLAQSRSSSLDSMVPWPDNLFSSSLECPFLVDAFFQGAIFNRCMLARGSQECYARPQRCLSPENSGSVSAVYGERSYPPRIRVKAENGSYSKNAGIVKNDNSVKSV